MAQMTEAKKGAAVQQPPPLRLSRVFHARRETVFKAWSSAEHVKRWFSPETFTVSDAKVQMQVGGSHVQTNARLAHIQHLETEVAKARARIDEIETSKAWLCQCKICSSNQRAQSKCVSAARRAFRGTRQRPARRVWRGQRSLHVVKRHEVRTAHSRAPRAAGSRIRPPAVC